MQSKKLPEFHDAIKEIADSIEESPAPSKHSRVLHHVTRKWSPALLGLLLEQQIIIHEQSKRLKTIPCFCGGGELLQVEYEDRKKSAFAQCFACADIRSVDIATLIYYNATPLAIASFITRCLADNDEPVALVQDRAFFVGETVSSVLIYVVCGFKNGDIQELLKACEKHAQTQSFLILTAHIPADIASKYTLLSIADKKLYLLSDNGSITLDSKFLDSFFAKRTINQDAANARWASKKKTEQKLMQYLESNIHGWPDLHHAQIAQHIYKHNKEYIKYKNLRGDDTLLSEKQVKDVVRAFFITRGEKSRIFGLSEYNSDDYT